MYVAHTHTHRHIHIHTYIYILYRFTFYDKTLSDPFISVHVFAGTVKLVGVNITT